MEPSNPPADVAAEPVNYTAWIGLDWGDRQHAWTLEEAGGRLRHGQVEQSPEQIDQWVTGLLQTYGAPIAVAVEQKRGALVAMLHKYEGLHVYPVHPNTAAQYRKMFHPSGSKNDTLDGRELLDLLRKHPERLQRLELDTPVTRELQQLVEQRRRLVDEHTRQSNRLTEQLKIYYPQVLRWWKEVSAPAVLPWLAQWPTLDEAQRAKPAQVRRLLQQHGFDQPAVSQHLQELAGAVPALTDVALLNASRLYILALVGVMEPLRQAIAIHEQRIKALTKSHPDYAIVSSFPGAGEALAPRLLVALGTIRERFDSASELQCYTGIAPVLRQSGRSQAVHFRWAAPKFLRQTFHEWASHSIRFSTWAADFYRSKKEQGKGHHAIVRALAFKWQRILFRCWKDGVAYDEARYLEALKQRAVAPLLNKAQAGKLSQAQPSK
jgi:transposase